MRIQNPGGGPTKLLYLLDQSRSDSGGGGQFETVPKLLPGTAAWDTLQMSLRRTDVPKSTKVGIPTPFQSPLTELVLVSFEVTRAGAIMIPSES